MSSILTNMGAMVALQTLRNINSGLNQTQNDISTGKHIASAKDNAAVWAITKVMESDVAGFKGINDSLALGSSTIAVAASASEKITDLLKEVKQKIVASQEQNVDRGKIQADIEALRGQISSISGAAQFNGLNLLSTTPDYAVGADIADLLELPDASKLSVLSSLDRSGSGTVAASYIDANRANLTSGEAVFGTGSQLAAALTGTGTINAGNTSTVTVAGDTATAGRTGNAVIVGDSYKLVAGAVTATYVAAAGDGLAEIRDGLIADINKKATEAGVSITAVANGTAGIDISNGTAANFTTSATYGSGGKAEGGFSAINKIDVTTEEGAKQALDDIEGLLQTAITAAAEFGTAQKRIGIQREFVTSLMDSLKSGIGSLVDADMEEASARLQALQVQQQLGIQALSIANQAPQNILALFR